MENVAENSYVAYAANFSELGPDELVGRPCDSVTMRPFHTPGPAWGAMEVAGTAETEHEELTPWSRSRTLAARDVFVASLILALKKMFRAGL